MNNHQINAAPFPCDVTDGAAVQRLIGDVTVRFGRLDVLVNDAAYNKSIPFTDLDNLTLEVWDKIMAVNLTGPMSLIKAVAPVMKAHGRGRIVNIASVAVGPSVLKHDHRGAGGAVCRPFSAGAAGGQKDPLVLDARCIALSIVSAPRDRCRASAPLIISPPPTTRLKPSTSATKSAKGRRRWPEKTIL